MLIAREKRFITSSVRAKCTRVGGEIDTREALFATMLSGKIEDVLFSWSERAGCDASTSSPYSDPGA
jgi:hypothetical protein